MDSYLLNQGHSNSEACLSLWECQQQQAVWKLFHSTHHTRQPTHILMLGCSSYSWEILVFSTQVKITKEPHSSRGPFSTQSQPRPPCRVLTAAFLWLKHIPGTLSAAFAARITSNHLHHTISYPIPLLHPGFASYVFSQLLCLWLGHTVSKSTLTSHQVLWFPVLFSC